MGQSTDAILCLGIQFDEGEEAPWADKAEGLGYDEPFDEQAVLHVLTGEKVDWLGATDKLKELGLEIVTHCHYECPMYILAVGGTVMKAHRGYPKEIEPRDDLDFSEASRRGFESALHKLGIQKSIADAIWLLCAYWH